MLHAMLRVVLHAWLHVQCSHPFGVLVGVNFIRHAL